MMKERFCGELKIELEVIGEVGDGHEANLLFGGRAILGEESWAFDNVQVQTDIETEEAYDIAAAGVVHYATLFTESHDGPVPDWAPPVDFCNDAVCAIDCDDRGYCIRRTVDGPDTYSG
jgi:hypothetical protein